MSPFLGLVGVLGIERPRELQVPIMHSVQIHPAGKQVGSPREPERREVPSVGAAPHADAGRVHLGARSQVTAGGLHVVVVARAGCAVVESFPEVEAIANAAAEVHREHYVARCRQVLIERIGIRVVFHVVPAEQHLAARPSVEEDHRGRRPGRLSRRQEELAVQLEAIGRPKYHRLRRHHPVEQKVGSIRGGVHDQVIRSDADHRAKPNPRV